MMSPDDSIPIQPSGSNKDDSQKTVANRPTAEPQRCPRCDSPNTKFCYYNNYNLSQPRYFCKTCRRYWTKGGALRNIPIGGGCRKNKKIYSKSSSSNSRFASDSLDSAGSSSYLDHIGGVKFSNLGLSSAMNFHTVDSNFAKIISPIPHYQQFSTASSFGNISRSLPSTSCFGLHNPSGDSSGTFMGFNFHLSSSPGLKQDYGNVQVLQDHHDIKKNDIVASSIESLSSINQDLHWKLQQERLGIMMFDGENDIMNTKVASSSSEIFHPEMTLVPQKPQPILFENLEISSRVKDHDVHQAVGDFRKDNNNGSLATEWFFDQNSNYSPVENPTQTNSNTGITGINQAWCNFN